jgi:hypothetical protein
MFRRKVLLLALLALPWFPRFALAAGSEGHKAVLVLYAEQRLLPAHFILDESIRSTISAGSSGPVDFYSEYLDLTRFPRARYKQEMVDFFRRKYAGRKIDLIIPVTVQALDFLLKSRAELFPGAPVVFAGVEQRQIEGRELGPNVTGVVALWDVVGTLDVALRLQPKTRRVVVVGGTSSFDRAREADARSALRKYEGRVEVIYLTDLPMEQILASLLLCVRM